MTWAATLWPSADGAFREHGIERMVGEILANNQHMIRLTKSLGFNLVKSPDDESIRLAIKQL